MAHLFVAMQFGLYLAAFVYFAFKGGNWLDIKFGTYPLFSFGLVLLAVVNSFVSLISKMNLIEMRKRNKEKFKEDEN